MSIANSIKLGSDYQKKIEVLFEHSLGDFFKTIDIFIKANIDVEICYYDDDSLGATVQFFTHTTEEDPFLQIQNLPESLKKLGNNLVDFNKIFEKHIIKKFNKYIEASGGDCETLYLTKKLLKKPEFAQYYNIVESYNLKKQNPNHSKNKQVKL